MKKFLLLLAAILIFIPAVNAKNVKVRATEDFSTANPPKIWSIELVDGFESKDGMPFYAGSVITGKVTNVTSPKRLKRNASFSFIPVSYHDSLSGRDYNIKEQIRGKYSALTDVTVGSVVKTGAVAAGSHFVSGFIGPGVALVEGAVKNENGNRAVSAVKSVYESTPVSYVEKGKELEIKKNQIFVMSFKTAEEEETESNPATQEEIIND